jgi:hypothetical protein
MRFPSATTLTATSLGLALLTIFPGNSTAAITFSSNIQACQIAAGFAPDYRLLKDASAGSVSPCRDVADLDPGSTLSAAFSEQDTAEPRNRHQPPAEEGKADALYNLALLSLGDKASEANVPKTLVLLEKAAEQGLAAAWNLQAWLLIRGIGSPANRDRAIVLYRRAADAGDVNAMYNWAVLNLETRPGEAVGYLKKAVEQKHIGAMALLGESLLRGRLVARQSALAVNLLTAAAPHSRRAAWVLGVAASTKQAPDIPIATASKLLGMARQEQTEELGGKPDDEPPWSVASEPTDWAKLERLLSRIGNERNHLRRRAAAAVAAHALLAQLGPAASRELLADALSNGQIGLINDGARQVASALQLGSLKPTFPKVANANVEAMARGTGRGTSRAGAAKAAAPAPSNDSDASLVANFNKLWSGGDRHEQWQAVRLLLLFRGGMPRLRYWTLPRPVRTLTSVLSSCPS